MKEVNVQFNSGRKICVLNVTDYVETADYDVIVTEDEEHITIFKNTVEYMSVKDMPMSIKDIEKAALHLKGKCDTCGNRNYSDPECLLCADSGLFTNYEKEEK